MEDIELYFMEAEEHMTKTIDFYKNKLSRINVGRANPLILSSVKVNYYEVLTSIHELATISVHQGTQLVIKPFDHATTKNIVAAITAASLGVDVKDEGDRARINFPKMTTDKRRVLVKDMAIITEAAKVDIRQARQTLNKIIKKSDISIDQQKELLNDMQKLTNKYIDKIVVLHMEKEKELLTL